jgi:beta-barrel assembly-enhancing protease
MRILLQPFLLIASAFLAGCAGGVRPAHHAHFEKNPDEDRLWRRAAEEEEVLVRSGFLYSEPEVVAYVQSIAERLRPEGLPEEFGFRIYVLRDPHLNAFALPNGAVFLHTGMIARMENEAQLAMLLGHEMTHATHRHALRTTRHARGAGAVGAVLHTTLGGATLGATSLLGGLGAGASVAGYSRGLEREADTYGFELAVAAGYDPEEGGRLFQFLLEDVKEDGRREPFFFGSHPRLVERIQSFEELAARHPRSAPALRREAEFRGVIRPLLWENILLDLRAGRLASAERALDRYEEFHGQEARTLGMRGEICARRNEECASEYWEGALALDATYAPAHRGLGVHYFRREEYSAAAPYLEAYLQLAPDATDRVYIQQYLEQCLNHTSSASDS